MGYTQLEDGTYVPSYYTNIDFSSNYWQADMNTDYATNISEKNSYLTGNLYPLETNLGTATYGSAPSSASYTSYGSSTYPSVALNTALNKSSTTDYTTGYQNVISTKNAVQKARRDLDVKISFINSPKNVSGGGDSSMLYNATFYMTILWTILATFLIYYVFVEL